MTFKYLIGQKKIFSAKVLVIGIGGLGSPLIIYLANSGVGNIGIVDHDKVDMSNLNRQILFTTNDLGKLKTMVAYKRLKNINPKSKIEIIAKFKMSLFEAVFVPTRLV